MIIPVTFIWESPPPPPRGGEIKHFLKKRIKKKAKHEGKCARDNIRLRSRWTNMAHILFFNCVILRFEYDQEIKNNHGHRTKYTFVELIVELIHGCSGWIV